MRLRRSINTILGALWLSAIGTGLYILTTYDYTAGAPAHPPINWPSDTKIRLDNHHPTLIMLIHPHCPCSRASISELSELMTRERGKLSAYVLCVSPKGTEQGWEKTDLWYSAAAIPGVSIMSDPDGIECRRFRAMTSGQIFVYGADRHLLFSGGITGSRGHAGDNSELQTVASVVDGKICGRHNGVVFGCLLLDPTNDKNTGVGKVDYGKASTPN